MSLCFPELVKASGLLRSQILENLSWKVSVFQNLTGPVWLSFVESDPHCSYRQDLAVMIVEKDFKLWQLTHIQEHMHLFVMSSLFAYMSSRANNNYSIDSWSLHLVLMSSPDKLVRKDKRGPQSLTHKKATLKKLFSDQIKVKTELSKGLHCSSKE